MTTMDWTSLVSPSKDYLQQLWGGLTYTIQIGSS
jgi:hypothetical protein